MDGGTVGFKGSGSQPLNPYSHDASIFQAELSNFLDASSIFLSWLKYFLDLRCLLLLRGSCIATKA
jgi:hypothetical protein